MVSCVAPGGVLLIQDCDVRSAEVLPSRESDSAWRKVVLEAFEGGPRRRSRRLPPAELLVRAGMGAVDGTDVADRLEPFGTAGPEALTGVLRGVLEAAIAHGITTAEHAAVLHDRLAHDAERLPTAR